MYLFKIYLFLQFLSFKTEDIYFSISDNESDVEHLL